MLLGVNISYSYLPNGELDRKKDTLQKHRGSDAPRSEISP